MKASDLMKTLNELDRQEGLWLFTTAMLKVVFLNESDTVLNRSLYRHVAAGFITQVKKGLYANDRALSAPLHKMEALVPYLRPEQFNYVSQESRLSDLGMISQMPINHLTLMTTGRKQTFETYYGTVEFTHTSRSPEYILENTTFNKSTGLLEATEECALKDLRRAGRNLDLVDTQHTSTSMSME